MKKLFVFCSMLALVALAGMAFAQELYPRVDGNDILIPVYAAQKGGLDLELPIYAAHDVNGWSVSGVSLMLREGEMLRARGLAGQRFHPVNLGADGKPVWLKIENVYPLESKFIDNSGSGPCFLVFLVK